ncbi:MAG TPA: hypothetical protein VGD17_01130 [Chitinophagaceae bacterium]
MNIQTGSTDNFASLKTPIFTDALCVRLANCLQGLIEGILLDEHGTICRRLETELAENDQEFTWSGLNDLPYGIYTLQLMQGANEMNMRIVKRV